MKQLLYKINQIDQIYTLSQVISQDIQNYSKTHEIRDILAHIYWRNDAFDQILTFVKDLEDKVPGIHIAGLTTSCETLTSDSVITYATISISIFSHTSILIQTCDCRLSDSSFAARQIVATTKKYSEKIAIEVLATVKHGLNVQNFFDEIDVCDPSISIFGAGADSCSPTQKTYVFSNDFLTCHGIVSILYISNTLYIDLYQTLRWLPLGKKMKVTKANDKILYELDGHPAYDVYQKYLNIKNDSHFYEHANAFPLLYYKNDIELARIPMFVNHEGALVLGATIEEGSMMSLSYLDPMRIVSQTAELQKKIYSFAPDAVMIYVCVNSRTFNKSFYRKNNIMPSSALFSAVGCYTYGEIFREHGKTYMNNASILAFNMREGEKEDFQHELQEPVIAPPISQYRHMQSFIHFIQVVTEELENTNKELIHSNKALEETNRVLQKMAVTDSLTKLFNRRELEQVISQNIENMILEDAPKSLLMLDIDNFKYINDNFGHNIGDNVLIKTSHIIKETVGEYGVCGRWGGEEFMIFINLPKENAFLIAEKIRSSLAKSNFYPLDHVSISGGLVAFVNDESIYELYKRVDLALYEAKSYGKNRIVLK